MNKKTPEQIAEMDEDELLEAQAREACACIMAMVSKAVDHGRMTNTAYVEDAEQFCAQLDFSWVHKFKA